MGYADQIHCNFPVPTMDSTRTARASENFNAEETKQAETEGAVESSSEDLDERNHAILTKGAKPGAVDGGMSWGTGNGGTQTTAERGSETIQPAAREAMGIEPMNVTQQSPTPTTLGEPLRPVSGSGSHGNFNMSDIANYRIG
jgi:hypothetical protein